MKSLVKYRSRGRWDRRRGGIEIKIDILKSAVSPIKITALLEKANLDWHRVREEIDSLIKAGLLHREDRFFVTTEGGMKTIDSWSVLMRDFEG